MVPHSVENKQFLKTAVDLKLFQEIHKLNGLYIQVVSFIGKIGQHPRAVRTLPPEEMVRENIAIVPAYLLGDKSIYPRLLEELGHIPVIAKGIRIPAYLYICPKLFLEISLAVKQLPGPGFASDKVAVGFGPHPPRLTPSVLV